MYCSGIVRQFEVRTSSLSGLDSVTFLTDLCPSLSLECVRVRGWLSPSLRSVGACVWLPERVVVSLYIPWVYF